MKNLLLGVVFLFLSTLTLHAKWNIYSETILWKKCEVEDFSNLWDFRLPLSSNKNLLNSKTFIIKKKNNKWEELVFIDWKYYLSHYFENNTLTFLDDWKKYYWILKKENWKKVFNLNWKESSEFESIYKINSYWEYEFEKQIFVWKKESIWGKVIYIKNWNEFKKDFVIANYFYINWKIYYLGLKNKKAFIIDEDWNKTKEYDYINELTVSDNKTSYSFIWYNKNINHSIVKDWKELIQYTKDNSDYLYNSNFYTVFWLRYFDENISFFVKKINGNNKYVDYYHNKESKIIKKRSYNNVENKYNGKFFINNSKDRVSFRDSEYIKNSIIIWKSEEWIISFIYPSWEEFILKKNYDFDIIYRNTDWKFIFVIKNKNEEKFLITNNKKNWPYKYIELVDHSLKSNKTVFKWKKENWKQVIIFNWKESKEYDEVYVYGNVDDSAWEFYTDWLKYTYVASTKWTAWISVSVLIEDWVEWKLYPNISNKPWIDNLTYSTDWKVFAYTLKRENWVIVEQNWIKSNIYKDVWIVTYDKEKESFWLFAKKQNLEWTYVENFKEIWKYKGYYDTYLSKDKTKFYFTDEENNLVENWKIIWTNIISYFSLNEKHFIYSKWVIDPNNKDIYSSFELHIDWKPFRTFKEMNLIWLDEKWNFFSFLWDKKFYKCKIEEEKVINKILNNVKENNKNIYLYFFAFITVFLIIFILFIKYKLNDKKIK